MLTFSTDSGGMALSPDTPYIRELCRVGCDFPTSGNTREYPGTPHTPLRRSSGLWPSINPTSQHHRRGGL